MARAEPVEVRIINPAPLAFANQDISVQSHGDDVEFVVALHRQDGAFSCGTTERTISAFGFDGGNLLRTHAREASAWECSSVAFNRQARHVVLAMITTSTHSAWPDDVPIQDLDAAALPAPSVVRWKLFTLDASLVMRRAGALSARDRATCRAKQPLAI